MAKDTIVIYGCSDPKLPRLLARLGYEIFLGEEQIFPQLVKSRVLDLILIDARGEIKDIGTDLCDYLRAEEVTRQSPIVFLSNDAALPAELQASFGANFELIDGNCSIGLLASRIATHLRLRKFAGEDSQKATLAEMNAALRDLNERFKHEREQARTIQLGLLPKNLPQSRNFELAVAYQPLDEVGGDWYFTSELPDGRISMLVADVTGHGLSAAFIGSMTKLALFAAADQQPATKLQEINRLMTPSLPEGRFITMFNALYDPKNGQLEFGRAGHPPALWLNRATGKVEELKSNGFAIGFFDDSQYQLGDVKLGVSDTLVLLTDGIPEAQNRDMELYGSARMNQVLLRSSPQASAKEILDSLLEDFRTFISGRVLKDDYTVLVLKRLK